MEIIIIQSSIGCFNWVQQHEKSLVFKIGIFDDERKVFELDGIKCLLEYSTKEDIEYKKDELEEYFNNGKIGKIFNECIKYSDSIFSSTNYKGQCIAFWKVYQNNKKELSNNFVKQKKESISKQIDRLQNDLISLDSFEYDDYEYSEYVKDRISLYEELIKEEQEDIMQIKEDTERYNKNVKRINEYKDDLKQLKSLI
jgi:hypothetical protein